MGSPTFGRPRPLPADTLACTTTVFTCSIAIEPAAVTNLPIGAFSRSPAENGTGLICACAACGRTQPADTIELTTNAAIIGTRIGSPRQTQRSTANLRDSLTLLAAPQPFRDGHHKTVDLK